LNLAQNAKLLRLLKQKLLSQSVHVAHLARHVVKSLLLLLKSAPQIPLQQLLLK
jgi:hypothetical protein